MSICFVTSYTFLDIRNMGGVTLSKYNARKTVIDGITFDSKAEGEYYSLLKKMQSIGAVKAFKTQPVFLLQDSFEKNGKKYRKIEYIADFLIEYTDGSIEVVDIKGFETPDFKIKRKLFEMKYPYNLILLKYVKKYGGWISVDEWKRRKKEEKKHAK